MDLLIASRITKIVPIDKGKRYRELNAENLSGELTASQLLAGPSQDYPCLSEFKKRRICLMQDKETGSPLSDKG
jgi:hypothetical protein